MSPARHRVRAVLASVVTLLLVGIGVAAHPAHAAPAHAAPESPGTGATDEPRFLRLDIESVTPETVTTASPGTVTVEGSVRNIGDRAVSDVSVRLQRAPAVTSSPQLRTALSLDQSNFDTVGTFETVSDELGRGESAPFRLSLPLTSDTDLSLDITDPGVYPMLVNVNGTPDYGGAARLDEARFLLPVTSLPGDGAKQADTSSPVGMTVVWPFADEPKRAAGMPGSPTEPTRLVDDTLATSLADGGRLDGLLAAVEEQTRENQDRTHALRSSMCLAVDPDLLGTVEDMTRGYLVVDDVADPSGAAHDGTGRDAATEWLTRLRELAASMCVTSLPFAQVDLRAVGAVGDPQVTAAAVDTPADTIDRVLGVTSVRDLVWPDAGALTPAAAQVARGSSTRVALVAANTVEGAGDERASGIGHRVRVGLPDPPISDDRAGALDAVLFDPSVSAALAGVGETPQTPSFVPKSARYALSDDSRTARLQDAFGAVAWSALTPPSEGLANRSSLVVPPQLWTAGPKESSALLATIGDLLRTGLATPRPLSDVLSSAPVGSAELAAPEQVVVDGVPEHVRAAAADQLPRIDDLTDALVLDPQAQLTPALFTSPLRGDLLRAMSLAHRRDDRAAHADDASTTRVNQVAAGLDRLWGAVTVVSPGGVYTLTSEQSPLLLVARNELPIGITVQLHVQAPDEMKITDIGPTQLPPRGSRTLTVPTEIDDSRKLVVQFSLTSMDGRQFGEPTSVTVRSNAYGQALAVLTGCAGALLLFLAGRRLWHRFRGQPDPADEGYERT
ncbi:DUF6049 family protein [Rhodococcus sp. HNM0569]|uniref:DUF6049 family protein n=1 Tax=Rhodococcus sp. HNM0569 TaxID=2716340 RepID=UPI00146F4CDE|nr:DUF6049 family protein [Rhodococcus sp. HNM0569]NLU84497.1 glycoprotein [Rhodococcus sp. HNM0569]